MERDLSRDIDHVVAELQARCRPCAAAPPWRGALRHGPRAQEDIARSQRDKAEMQAVRSRTPLLAGINQTSLPLSYPSHCSHIPLIALISLSSLFPWQAWESQAARMAEYVARVESELVAARCALVPSRPGGGGGGGVAAAVAAAASGRLCCSSARPPSLTPMPACRRWRG